MSLDGGATITPLILALDGHDAAGKTTLARWLARRLGAEYVRPFAGSVGERMLAAAVEGRHALVASLARGAVERTVGSTGGRLLVCDRHWMTAFTLLPEPYWEEWGSLPPTILCWAGLAATRARLRARDGDPGDDAWHRYYLHAYRRLAERFGCEILHTDRLAEPDAMQALADWADRARGRCAL